MWMLRSAVQYWEMCKWQCCGRRKNLKSISIVSVKIIQIVKRRRVCSNSYKLRQQAIRSSITRRSNGSWIGTWGQNRPIKVVNNPLPIAGKPISGKETLCIEVAAPASTLEVEEIPDTDVEDAEADDEDDDEDGDRESTSLSQSSVAPVRQMRQRSLLELSKSQA
jgi:hypothetical protein